MQDCVAMWLVLHGDPHDPQFETSTSVFDSHPSRALLLLQSENPLRHGPEHTPPEHKGVTLLLEHVMPHAPQLSVTYNHTLAYQRHGYLLIQTPFTKATRCTYELRRAPSSHIQCSSCHCSAHIRSCMLDCTRHSHTLPWRH